jgi:geranylgeranyl diphosphate synthase, type I
VSTTTPPRPDETPAVPDEITVIAEPVGRRLASFLDEQISEWTHVDPDVEPALDAIRQLVFAGGKRLRPAFCYWAFVGAGGDPNDPIVIDAGAAFEMLHAFALIHDDVMDGSVTRRGAPTLHVSFAERHRQEGLRGEARRFGEGVAILAGDLAAVFADRLLGSAPRQAIDTWHRLEIEVNIGQYLDVVGTARGEVDLEAARRISRLKSGKYTVERPLHLGASLARALDRLGPSLSAFGEPLGEAFQMRDDLLGVFGDPASTGKPVADDLREGKPTPLLAIARQRATAAELGVLGRIGEPNLGDDELHEIRHILDTTGARREVETTIDRLCDEALAQLQHLSLAGDARRSLGVLARYVAYRDR